MARETHARSPLREEPGTWRSPEPCTMVIFGATGDLSQGKLFPALYHLAQRHLLPRGFSVVGYARRGLTHDDFRKKIREAVNASSGTDPIQDPVWESFARGLYYLQAEFDNPGAYPRLAGLLSQIEKERGTQGNRIFYLATPPSSYEKIIEQLGASGLASERGSTQGRARVVIEKPFGRDSETAERLNRTIAQVLAERQIYRIDHYLGKETVQNMLVFRFANAIFEPIWDRHYIDHVQISVAEDIGIGNRGGYYEESGVIRDMFQNHLLHLLCLTAMEPPVSFDADAVRDEKVKILRAIRPIQPDEIGRFAVRGQYGEGAVNGKKIPAYRDEPRVKTDSATPTFSALKLFINNWRWQGVPFYLRSGKRLPKKVTEITIQFKRVPHLLFQETAENPLTPNLLALRIQPDEGISIVFEAKLPGPAIRMQSVTMDFHYATSFGVVEPPSAYQRLLLDCMLGDATLFTRSDEVEWAWSLMDPILEAWESSPPVDFPNYEAGSWGPKAADALIEQDGRRWR